MVIMIDLEQPMISYYFEKFRKIMQWTEKEALLLFTSDRYLCPVQFIDNGMFISRDLWAHCKSVTGNADPVHSHLVGILVLLMLVHMSLTLVDRLLYNSNTAQSS